jgi:hypothetical protein
MMNNRDDDRDEERGSKFVKAGVAVGIGSAAIVAALLYASKAKKKRGSEAADLRPYHSSSGISWS